MAAKQASKEIESAYCGALYWIRFGEKPQPILPWTAVKYFLVFLGCLIVLVGLVEFRLGTLAREGRVVTEDWQSEDAAINRMNKRKVKADRANPLWYSEGIPLPGAKSGKRRLLVVGDSFVWGDGYSNVNTIWWRQLERELRHRGYHGVEVVAAGLNATSTQDHLHWLRDLNLIEKLEPDGVVLGYVTNDPDMKDAQGRFYVKQIGREVRIPRWRGVDRTLGRVAPILAAQLKQQLERKWESRLTDAYHYSEWELRLLEPPNIETYRRVVGELGEFIRSRHLPFLAVTLPNAPDREYFEPRHRPIGPIFAAAGLRFHDLLDDFVRAYPPDGEVLRWGINPANGHPGPVSTRFYAREVADILEREFPNLLGGKDTPPSRVPAINDWMPPDAGVRRIEAGEWELDYPGPEDTAPRLPLAKPHVVLAFAEPVAVRRVTISGALLRESELYFSAVDPATGIEGKDNPSLGIGNGNSVGWSLEGAPGADRVNTLKLVAEFDPAAKDPKARRLNLKIEFDEDPVRP